MEKYLTPTERKKKYVFLVDHFEFESCMDLSEPIIVRGYCPGKGFRPGMESILAREVGIFIARWLNDIYPSLNGFSGLDTLRYEFED